MTTGLVGQASRLLTGKMLVLPYFRYSLWRFSPWELALVCRDLTSLQSVLSMLKQGHVSMPFCEIKDEECARCGFLRRRELIYSDLVIYTRDLTMSGINLRIAPAIPSETECYALLERHGTPQHIVAHSRKVWELGRLLGESLLKRNHIVDIDLLCASCLLHDIGKYPCILDGTGYHDVRGEKILEEEGYSDVARIVVQHVVLRGPNSPIREEHVLFYSDKRVVHDELVSLDDRFIYLEQTYGTSALAVERLMLMKQETLRLEKEIFELLDFGPEDVFRLLD